MRDKDFLFTGPDWKDNWFYNKYYTVVPGAEDTPDKLNYRFFTFHSALSIINQRTDNPVIIETGCQRESNDFGAGMSTSIFAEYVQRYGGKLIVVDNNEVHLDRARGFVSEFNLSEDQVEFHLSDSVKFLQEYKEPVDLLFLDSYDYPYGEMLNKYGGQSNIHQAEVDLRSRTYQQIHEEFGNIIIPCQLHCVEEFKACENIINDTVLLIDDNCFPGGGKPGMLKPYLLDQKWTCIADGQQTLWVK